MSENTPDKYNAIKKDIGIYGDSAEIEEILRKSHVVDPDCDSDSDSEYRSWNCQKLVTQTIS